jgi:hypothetical protein
MSKIDNKNYKNFNMLIKMNLNKDQIRYLINKIINLDRFLLILIRIVKIKINIESKCKINSNNNMIYNIKEKDPRVLLIIIKIYKNHNKTNKNNNKTFKDSWNINNNWNNNYQINKSKQSKFKKIIIISNKI